MAQAIPTYTIGFFKIPNSLCNDINSTLAKYRWGQTKVKKKIYWINWKKLCNPKTKGEMGFCDIHAFNLTMLAKQAWRLVHYTHLLFYKVYKARHFTNCSFLEASVGSNPSFVWQSLLMAREILVKGTKWQVGDGRQIEVASHKWLPHALVFLGPSPSPLYARDLIDKDTRQWDCGKLQALFAPSNQQEILTIPLNNLTSKDKLNGRKMLLRSLQSK